MGSCRNMVTPRKPCGLKKLFQEQREKGVVERQSFSSLLLYLEERLELFLESAKDYVKVGQTSRDEKKTDFAST